MKWSSLNPAALRTGLIGIALCFTVVSIAGTVFIRNNEVAKNITFGNAKLAITLDYSRKCVVTAIQVNGQAVVSGTEGVFSSVSTSAHRHSTLNLTTDPMVKTEGNTVSISNITYGLADETIHETWHFSISETDIRFQMERNFPKSLAVEEVSFPYFTFDSINTWDGAFLGYGGLAWFYLFNAKLCTYGVHSESCVFWNSATGNGLKVEVAAPGKQLAMKFSRTADDKLNYSIAVSDSELTCRYESEKRSRFIRGKSDVWDSFTIPAGNYTQTITLSYVDYQKEYNRGKFVNENQDQITKLLNTVARIGVIDEKHFGGNSWHTPYGPICLHEQYIAQFAIGINDEQYTEGYKRCLDFYRDNAIQPDGRVIARWAYLDEDAIPGSVTGKGFYEAQWGYLMDSNPDFVTNVADLYNLSGDLNWVKAHKESCEKALDYMLKRDTNGNHLVEMMTESHTEKRGSDWIDIIWASWENAFVNAKLYHALVEWSDVEKQLGDPAMASHYLSFADALKKSFNLTTSEGGFWNPSNKWYVHWLDKDNSVHGDNLVVPVNFMAIVYGICDDTIRRNYILEKIEEQTRKENLFFWPICLYPYAVGEGNDWQFPFPNYENGDIFLSWGSVGVEAYAGYKPELALKYVDNVLNRYEKDGLAFQRYGRVNQEGLGDDILSGNSLAVVGLYKAIFGVNPLHNRLYLNPHLPDKLSGTELNYTFRNEKLKVGLSTNAFSVSNQHFKIGSTADFGFYSAKDELMYFHKNDDAWSLKASTADNLSIEIINWGSGEYSWRQSLTSTHENIAYTLRVPDAGSIYTITDGNKSSKSKSDALGNLKFDSKPTNNTITIRKIK